MPGYSLSHSLRNILTLVCKYCTATINIFNLRTYILGTFRSTSSALCNDRRQHLARHHCGKFPHRTHSTAEQNTLDTYSAAMAGDAKKLELVAFTLIVDDIVRPTGKTYMEQLGGGGELGGAVALLPFVCCRRRINDTTSV